MYVKCIRRQEKRWLNVIKSDTRRAGISIVGAEN